MNGTLRPVASFDFLPFWGQMAHWQSFEIRCFTGCIGLMVEEQLQDGLLFSDYKYLFGISAGNASFNKASVDNIKIAYNYLTVILVVNWDNSGNCAGSLINEGD